MSYKTMIRLLNALPLKGAHPAAKVGERLEKDGDKRLTDRGVAKGLHAICSAPNSPIEEIHTGSGIATRWKWRERHPLRSLAFRDAELLQQTLLHQMARRLMPPAIADHLEQDQKWIASKLDPNSQAAWWLEHVINLPAGPPRFPKPLDESIVQEVSKALWNRRQLQVEYRSRTARVAKSMVLHPQGLVLDGEALTLIAVANDYMEPYNFNLMRMTKAQMLPGDSRRLEGFDFKQHVAKNFGWPYGEPEQIEFWVHVDRVIEFEEMPISKDQKIDPKPDEDGYHRVTATVVPNVRLDAFLLSFGDQVCLGVD
jgi:predicted DNA-binding transcriptional regulator YafY